MKIWHKILVAPALAMLFLIALGATAYSVLYQQNEALVELFTERFGSYQLAARSSQEIGEVHATVYRLFTWIGNLKEERIKQISGEQLAKIDRVGVRIKTFEERHDLEDAERTLAAALLKQVANYRKGVDVAV